MTTRYAKLLQDALQLVKPGQALVTEETTGSMETLKLEFKREAWVSISYCDDIGESVSWTPGNGRPEDSFDSDEFPELNLHTLFIQIVRKLAASK